MTRRDDPFSGFGNFITSVDELEAVSGPAMPQAVDKEIPALDSICREFISRSPFCFLATASPSGHLDLSPKGDPAGFVKVINESLLAIPDRPGNRRMDSFHNLLEDPRIGLLFFVPGRGETLRVRGIAKITKDADLLDTLAVNGRGPALALLVHVRSAFMHCPKCVFRSGLWQPDKWPDTAGLADMNEAMVKHAKIAMRPDEWFEALKEKGELELW